VSKAGVSAVVTASLDMSGVTDFVHQRGVIELSGNASGTTFGGQIRVVGHCEYIQAMALGDSSLTKKPWASIDVDEIFPGLTSSSATTANDSLQELEQAGTFHRVGVRRVRGVETTLYSGTIAAGTVSARRPKRLGDALKKEHVASIPTRAWIDRSGFVRKLTESVNGVVVTIELYDFGVPVHVTAPSPADVQDLTSKFKSVLGG